MEKIQTKNQFKQNKKQILKQKQAKKKWKQNTEELEKIHVLSVTCIQSVIGGSYLGVTPVLCTTVVTVVVRVLGLGTMMVDKVHAVSVVWGRLQPHVLTNRLVHTSE